MNIEAITGIVSAVATTATGILAWRAAHSANKAATRSADVAEASERERQWDRLTPQLDFVCVAKDNSEQAELRIRLEGPYALRELTKVTVRIRDDRPQQGTLANMTLLLMQIAAGGTGAKDHVFGAYRFAPKAEGVDAHGRTMVVNGVLAGEDIVCLLDRTSPPLRDAVDLWAGFHVGRPVRITVECEREGYPLWHIPEEVEVITE
ncbi:hypothetical protein AB0B94_31205 [Micromonospora sp. NPDC048986]|uniref:hypothetical protein n=1 Tax=Micromonospora sp. NPDC048986 TaxID=3155644 RepID=UPI0033DBFA58